MNLFLADKLEKAGGFLGKEESHHASRVLRLHTGDTILTTQGKGIIYHSRITALSKVEVQFKNLEVYKQEKEKPAYLHIAIAPTKSNDRFEFFLEKATEIGISEITPILCAHSERKVYKTDRGLKIVNSAAKQSLACWWPKLNEPVKISGFDPNNSEGLTKFIAHCEKASQANILPELPSFQKVVMLIGPEGDFSSDEIAMAKEKGYRECGLGPKRLRTETAGIAVALSFSLR